MFLTRLSAMSNNAQSLALRWLAQRSLSVREVEERLERQNCSTEDIAEAVSELTRLGFLNDERLAEQVLAKSLSHHEGPGRLAARMAQRGILPEVRREVTHRVNLEIDWLDVAEPLRERYDISSPKGRARFIRHLTREGFPAAVVYRLVGERSEDTHGIDDY